MAEAEIIPIKGDGELTLGGFLRLELARLQLDQTELARQLGVSRQTINNLINDHQGMSTAMARKLADMTGRSFEFWLRKRFLEFDIHPAAPSLRPSLLVDWQIEALIESNEVSIDPFVPERIQPASIDITIGHEIKVGGKAVDVSERGYALKTGQAAGIQSLETVTLGAGIAGLLSGMGSLAKNGLLYASGLQIDPGYSGALVFFVQNIGPNDLVLRAGMPIATITLQSLAEEPRRRFDRGDQRIFPKDGAPVTDAPEDVLRDSLWQQIAARLSVTDSSVNERVYVTLGDGLVEFDGTGLSEVERAKALAGELTLLERRSGDERLALASQMIGDLAVSGEQLLRFAGLFGFERDGRDAPEILRYEGRLVPFRILGRRDQKISLRAIGGAIDRSAIALFSEIWRDR